MVVSRITDSVRKADYGALLLEMFVLIVGILLALAADRWNRERQDALDQYVDFYYKTDEMDEEGMGVRFDFATLAEDRNLKNKVFDAVDTHGDWLRLQTRIYDITKRINEQLTVH